MAFDFGQTLPSPIARLVWSFVSHPCGVLPCTLPRRPALLPILPLATDLALHFSCCLIISTSTWIDVGRADIHGVGEGAGLKGLCAHGDVGCAGMVHEILPLLAVMIWECMQVRCVCHCTGA